MISVPRGNASLAYALLEAGRAKARTPGALYRCACDAHWTMEWLSDEIEEISEFVSNPTNLTDRKREISLVLGGMQRLAASVSQLAHAVDMIAWSHG